MEFCGWGVSEQLAQCRAEIAVMNGGEIVEK